MLSKVSINSQTYQIYIRPFHSFRNLPWQFRAVKRQELARSSFSGCGVDLVLSVYNTVQPCAKEELTLSTIPRVLFSRVVKTSGLSTISAIPMLSTTLSAPLVATALLQSSARLRRLTREGKKDIPRMHGKNDQLRILRMSSADQKVGSCLRGTVNTGREGNLSSCGNRPRQRRYVSKDRFLGLLKQRQRSLEQSDGSCGIDIYMIEEISSIDLCDLGIGGGSVVSCVCDDNVEVVDALVFDGGDGLETVSVGFGFYFDDDEFGARCFGDVVEGLLLGRIANGGYDSSVCTTEVLFQQRQTKAAVGAGDEDSV
jgi:hypothetical protein